MSKYKTETNKGRIQENAIKTLLKSNIFHHKTFKNKKSKSASVKAAITHQAFPLKNLIFLCTRKSLPGKLLLSFPAVSNTAATCSAHHALIFKPVRLPLGKGGEADCHPNVGIDREHKHGYLPAGKVYEKTDTG